MRDHWSDYIDGLPLYDRVLVAHGNPNNFSLIDRHVERCRMDLNQLAFDTARRIREVAKS